MNVSILHRKRAVRNVLLILLLCVAGLTNAIAQTFTEGGLNYIVNGDGTSVTVTGSVDGTNFFGSLTIPANVSNEGVSYSVTAVADYAFRDCFNLSSVNLPNSVNSLGTGAFYNCTMLASVSLSNIMTSIKSYTFYGCWCLHAITIPNSVTSIGSYAFYGCNLLEHITIPDSVTILGSYSLSNCIGIGSIVIGNGVTTIGDHAFYNTGAYGTLGDGPYLIITMGNSVTTIEDYAFSQCSINAITIPSSVTSIGNNAFSGSCLSTMEYDAANCTIGYDWLYNCMNFNDLTIGENVQVIPMELIKDPTRLEEIHVASGNPLYDSRNGCNAVIQTSNNELVMGCKNTSILNTVTSIGNYAFYDRSFLTSINIPNSVTSIGEYTFYDCTGLSSVTIPNSVTSIGSYAFSNCNGLTSVSISNTLISIEDHVFYQCSGLTSINIPNSVISIGNSAFAGCNGLVSVIIPNSVITIGSNAFYDCSGLLSATIGTSVANIGNGAFGGSSYITSLNYNATNCMIESFWLAKTYTHENHWLCEVSIGDNVQHIPNYFVNGCKNLTSISIPNSVVSIGEYAFANCSGFTTINLPDSLISIGNHVFYRCSNLTSIVMSNSLISIGNNAFSDCSALTSITIPNTVTSIGSTAFWGCTNLTTLNYNATNCTFAVLGGYSMWYNCSSLSNLNIGDDVQVIPDGFVMSCDGITENLVIPNAVVSIGQSAFSGCTGLTSVTIPNSVVSIGGYAFSFCSGLTSITIPESVTSIGNGVFENCIGLNTLNYNATNSTVSSDWSEHWLKACSSLTNLTIGDNVQAIPNWFVRDCSNLSGSLVIPNSVTSIGYYAFSGCSGFTSLIIGASATSIGNEAFSGCDGVSSLTVLAVTPPVVNYGNGSAFYFGIDNVPVYVPCGTTSAYLSVSGWDEFTNYQENCGPFTITATSNPTDGGIVEGAGTFNYDATATLTAIPNSGYTFLNWTENDQQVSMDEEYSFVVKSDRNLVANFTDNPIYSTISATANPSIGGTVTGDGVYLQGQTATLTAIANEGYDFINWTNDEGIVVSTNESFGFVVTEDITCVANFEYNVTFTTDFEDGSFGDWTTIDADGDGYNWRIASTVHSSIHGHESNNCVLSQSYITNVGALTPDNYLVSPQINLGGSISFWARAQDGSYPAEHFGVAVSTSGNSDPVDFTTIQEWTMTAKGTGDYSKETRDGSRGVGNWYQFTADLSAYNGQIGYVAIRHFNCTDMFYLDVDDIEITMTEPMYLNHNITATASPTNGGTVSGAGNYAEGAICTLTATANEGYTFINWIKDGVEVSTDAVYSFTVTEDAAFVANFELNSYDIFATVNPTTGGTVIGSGSYNYGVTCTLVATANSGYTFVNWTESGTQVSSDVNYSFTVTDNRDLVANFEAIQPSTYVITATANPTAGGTVSGAGTYDVGEIATMTATPNDGYTFLYWAKNGVMATEETTYTFTVTEDSDCVAYFAPEEMEVQVSSMSGGWTWYNTYIEQDTIDGLEILKNNLGAEGIQIKAQQGYTSYFEGYGWMGTLSDLDNESSYKVQTSAPCMVNMIGGETTPEQHPITITPGWNWIGYPLSIPMSVTMAFSNISPTNGDQLKAQNGYANYYDGIGWMGTLTTIEPGTGLLYKSNNSQTLTLVYPDPEGAKGAELAENVTADNNHWVPDMHAYPDNMTVTAVVELDDEELQSDSYELAAFANGECRGSVRLMYIESLDRHMAFLTITGEDVEALCFSLYDTQTGEEIHGASEQINFSNNATLGDLMEPYAIHFRGMMGTSDWANNVNIYPNPVRRGENINLSMANEVGKVQIEIINALGAVVETVCTPSVQTFVVPNVAGVYMLRISMEGKGTCYRKLVVQ